MKTVIIGKKIAVTRREIQVLEEPTISEAYINFELKGMFTADELIDRIRKFIRDLEIQEPQ